MLKDKRIIIVEDEPVVALDFLYFFKDNGFTNISSYYSGENALESIQDETPDIALLDIRLKKKVTGLDVAAELQKLNVPYIFISAFSDKNNYQRALKMNPAHIFYKPVDQKILLSTVESILRKGLIS